MSDQDNKNTSDKSVLDGSDQVAVRQAKLDGLRQAGNDPFASNWEQTHVSSQAVGLLPENEEIGSEVSVAGRIVAFRLMGKAAFLKLLDREGRIQAYVRRDEIGDDEYAAFKKLDLGDFIGVRGPLFRTKTGEVTVRAKEYRLVSKALRPLPEKWHGLSDNDQIYRQRYLDLVVNDESRQRFQTRSRIIREIREFMWSRDFIEVETPMLQSVSGGAAARPFRTHFNALDCDFNMRIALELHLKRMLVGGFDRVFEVGRVFRNEGLSRRHNPEFTMLEAYQGSARQTLTSWPMRGFALPMHTQQAVPVPLRVTDCLLGSILPEPEFSIPCSPGEKPLLMRKRKHWGIYFDPKDITPTWLENGTSVLTTLIRRKTSGQTSPCPMDPLTGDLILFLVFTPPPDPIRCAGSKTIASPENQPSH